MQSFIHPTSDVRAPSIGAGSQVGQFSVIAAGAAIGRNCTIHMHVVIDDDVRLGDNVTVHGGVQLWNGIVLEDDVTVGPNATFINDVWARGAKDAHPARTLVKRGASIGANATILPNLSIGEQAVVGAGAVVTQPVPDYAIVVGNPARITGYTHTTASQSPGARLEARGGEPGSSIVPGVELLSLRVAADMRGKLTVGQCGDDLPFVPQRVFMVHDVPSRETRGEHAHKECHQLLICAHGQCLAVADNGRVRQEFLLDASYKALYMPPRIWGTQYRYSEDAVLLVLASHAYDPADYIRDYREFLTMIEATAS